jgi:hypothetical protein
MTPISLTILGGVAARGEGGVREGAKERGRKASVYIAIRNTNHN